MGCCRAVPRPHVTAGFHHQLMDSHPWTPAKFPESNILEEHALCLFQVSQILHVIPAGEAGGGGLCSRLSYSGVNEEPVKWLKKKRLSFPAGGSKRQQKGPQGLPHCHSPPNHHHHHHQPGLVTKTKRKGNLGINHTAQPSIGEKSGT